MPLPLPPQNTSICGIIPTEYLLNSVRRSQTSKRARQSPPNWVGKNNLKKKKKKKKGERKREKGLRTRPALEEGCKGIKRLPHTRRALHLKRNKLGQKESFGVLEETSAISLLRPN